MLLVIYLTGVLIAGNYIHLASQVSISPNWYNLSKEQAAFEATATETLVIRKIKKTDKVISPIRKSVSEHFSNSFKMPNQ